MKSLLKYKIGLAVVAIFTLVLLVLVVSQASNVKQDNATYVKANQVATQLDNYVQSHDAPPRTLDAIGITDVPDTVKYTRLSSTRYMFCVSYKTNSSGFNATNIETELLTGGANPAASYYSSNQETSYLYLSSYHKKGLNCQTVKTFSDFNFYDNTSPSTNSSSSDSSTLFQ